VGESGPRPGAQASHEIRRDGGALNPFGWWAMLKFNTKVPPFDDPALRRALFPAVNQSDSMLAVVGEQVELMRTGVGMEVLTGPRDLDLARRLVRAAGYTGAPIVQMAPADVPRVFALSDVAHQMMTSVGLKVDYQAMDVGTLTSRANSGGQAG
jgi:peptide/nickel transport system substrate-binding protein